MTELLYTGGQIILPECWNKTTYMMSFEENEKGIFHKNGIIEFTKEDYNFRLQTSYKFPDKWLTKDSPLKDEIHNTIVIPTIDHFLNQFEQAREQIDSLNKFAETGKCQDHWDFYLSMEDGEEVYQMPNYFQDSQMNSKMQGLYKINEFPVLTVNGKNILAFDKHIKDLRKYSQFIKRDKMGNLFTKGLTLDESIKNLINIYKAPLESFEKFQFHN